VLSTLFGPKADAPAPKKPVPTPAVAPRTVPDELTVARQESTVALDALGSVLRAYARDAFDLGRRSEHEIRALVTAWGLHATIGAARPDHEGDRNGVPLLERDWKGLLHAFSQLRRQERQSVTSSSADLRAVVEAFVSAARSLAIDEDEAHRATAEILERVRWATTTGDTEFLKREALVAVDAIHDLLKLRRAKQQERFASLADSVRNLGHELEIAKTEAMMDSLTGLVNRKAFDLELTRNIELHAMLGQPACLLLVDVDRFKSVNDRYGHQVGDAVLQQVAQAHVRTFIRRCDVVSRWGGDEFAIIVPETGTDGAERLAERLRQASQSVEQIVPDMEEPPTLSIGIAELVLGDDAASWVRRADEALYAAKESGRDRFVLGE
jgi:diguanylate cyclase